MGEAAPTMPAAVLKGPGRISVEQVPVPTAGPGQVVVAVELCGICGSDLHLVLEGWARPGTWQGHEWTGHISSVGPGVEVWQVGDAVVGGAPAGCGACPMCRAGRTSLCDHRGPPGEAVGQGAFATFKLAAANELLPMPAELTPRAAALAEPLAVALHAIHAGSVQPGQRVMVIGAGPIGALAIGALRSMGVDDVACVEPNAARRSLATKVGATRVATPDELEVPSIAEPDRVVDAAVDVVLECAGRPSAAEAGLAQLRRGGTMVLVGAGIDAPRFDPNRIILNELVVTGAFNYDADGFEQALALLGSGALDVDALIEPEVVDLDGLLQAMRDLAEGRLAGKVLVRP